MCAYHSNPHAILMSLPQIEGLPAIKYLVIFRSLLSRANIADFHVIADLNAGRLLLPLLASVQVSG
jgi:hypothetical protein